VKKSAKKLQEHPRSLWGGVLVVVFVLLMTLLYSVYSGWIVRMWIPGSTAWPTPTPVVTPVPTIG
jgi:hypothetical protein